MSFSMRCPKCGLIQARRPTCKSCGAVVGGPDVSPSAPSVEIKRPAAPVIPSAPPPSETRQQPLQAGAEVDQTRRLSFHGTGGSLFEIQAVNILLTLVTLGIYSFWARSAVSPSMPLEVRYSRFKPSTFSSPL